MKAAPIFILLILVISCSGSKSVYWCGDHACINNKEKESYFKKTMIVEKKIIDKNNRKDLTKSEVIIKKAKSDEKKLEKKNKLEQKLFKKEQKEQAKRAKFEEKRLKKEQKELAKQAKIEEKGIRKKLSKKEKTKIKKNVETTSFSSSFINLNFEQLKDQIIKKNLIRSYPDINDIPKLR